MSAQPRPNPHNRRIKYVFRNGKARFSQKKLSMHPDCVKERRAQAKRRKLIDCRICVRCRYAFIAKGGNNICSPCWYEAHGLYLEEMGIPRQYYIANSIVRMWLERKSGLNARRTTNPRIPIPPDALDRLKPAIARAFERMIEHANGGRRCDSMPRLEGIAPFPDAPIANLRAIKWSCQPA
jgi:hypothetical protein